MTTTENLPVYVGPDGREHRNPWVDIVFMQGHQYDDPALTLLAEADFVDVTEIADYLAQWDYGTETDQAHTTDQDPRTADPFDTVHEVTLAEGHDYVLTMNRALGTISLSRRPLDWVDGEFAS